MRAYVLIESAVGKANSVGEGVKKLSLTDAAVVAVDAVTGPYDVIALWNPRTSTSSDGR